MDALLAQLQAQVFNLAIRTGFSLSSSMVISQCSRIIKAVNDREIIAKLEQLQMQLTNKIKILSPAIDLIEFRSSRGSALLEAVLPLAQSLRREIQALGEELQVVASTEEHGRFARISPMPHIRHHQQLGKVMSSIKKTLDNIDRDIPLLHFAISASGESLSSSTSATISLSRFAQASALLNSADFQFAQDAKTAVQVGPAFTLSLYMIFAGHDSSHQAEAVGYAGAVESTSNSRPIADQCIRRPIWQEVIHKVRVCIWRTPLDWTYDGSSGYRPMDAGHGGVTDGNASNPINSSAYSHPSSRFAYHLEMIEDQDDGRVHADSIEPSPSAPASQQGIRESVPIHQFSKLFYADTGRLLNIGGAAETENKPVLLLKRDISSLLPVETQGMRTASVANSEASETPTTASSIDICQEQRDVDQQLLSCMDGSRVSRGLSESAFPAHLDQEWLALEIFEEDIDYNDSDDSDEGDEQTSTAGLDSFNEEIQPGPLPPGLVEQMSCLATEDTSSDEPQLLTQARRTGASNEQIASPQTSSTAHSPFSAIVKSLSLLELLIRLTSLQESMQASHLTVDDHILNFFLEDSSTTGLTGREQQRARDTAKQRIGFDPYEDTSPR